MMLPIQIHPEANIELEEAASWYDQQRTGLGRRFLATVKQAIGKIRNSPKMHAAFYRNVRRHVLSRYPYKILYRIQQDHVQIVAVFHGRRDPTIWQRRI